MGEGGGGGRMGGAENAGREKGKVQRPYDSKRRNFHCSPSLSLCMCVCVFLSVSVCVCANQVKLSFYEFFTEKK